MDIITLRRNKKTPIKDSYSIKYDLGKDNIKFEREEKILGLRKAQLNRIISSKRKNIYIKSINEEIESQYNIKMNNFNIPEELKINISKFYQNVNKILLNYFYNFIVQYKFIFIEGFFKINRY